MLTLAGYFVSVVVRVVDTGCWPGRTTVVVVLVMVVVGLPIEPVVSRDPPRPVVVACPVVVAGAAAAIAVASRMSAVTMLTRQGWFGRADRQVRPSFRVVKVTGSPCTIFSQRPESVRRTM